MTRLDAHARFAQMTDRTFLSEWWHDDPNFVADAVALAEVSGMLDESETDDDLREAAQHGETLFASGVVDVDDLAEISNEVIMEFMRWCEAQGATCSEDS